MATLDHPELRESLNKLLKTARPRSSSGIQYSVDNERRTTASRKSRKTPMGRAS